MEKRILLAVSLSFVVLFVYQNFFVKPVTPRPGATRATQGAAAPGAGSEVGSAPAAVPATITPAAQPPAAAALAGPAPLVSDAAERDIVVETPVVRAVFSNRGAELKNWQLKRYTGPGGQPLDLVPAAVPGDHARPFSLSFPDAALTRELDQALFKPGADAATVSDRPVTLSFEFRDAAGLTARKDFLFDPSKPYVISFTSTVTRNGETLNPVVEWGPGLGDVPTETSNYIQQSEAIFAQGGSATRLAAAKLKDQAVHQATFDFAGVDDHYFLAAAIPRRTPATVRYAVVPIPVPAGAAPRELVGYEIQFASPPAAVPFFVGPKDFDVLANTDRELVRAINFGWFAFLVVPLLRSLKWLNGYIGNYGWSIITLTILINMAMFPLRHKSVVSMRKMQDIQPEVKAIQDRYSKLKTTDPARQKMNVELMNLYRERGVNPASGCLPMLLTMPVLFAFYSLLSVAIEIRGAPFMFWIKDLSLHDPMYVTPILMGITMVWQQRMTPTTADPMQQKVMMFMPVMFTFMFLWAPSGLVLYWLTSNLWGIGQQQVTNRLIGPTTVKVPGTAAERRVKRVGAGKSEQANERP